MDIQIRKNESDILHTVLSNIIKMLTARKLYKTQDTEKNISKLLSKQSDDMLYIIKTDDNNQIAIRIIPQKITAINKSFGIVDFLNNHKNIHKILVVHEISKKAEQFVHKNYPNTEIFLEEELMINIIEHEYVPKHIPLTEEEQQEVLEKYSLKRKQLPKILLNDPISRYYNMKPGSIFKIIRPCEKSGISFCYRLVIKK